MSDMVLTKEVSRSLSCPAGTENFSAHINAEEINTIFAGMIKQATGDLIAQGVGAAGISHELYVDMRFSPQIFDVQIEVATFPLVPHNVDELVETFVATYETRFGAGSSFRVAGIDLSTFRVVSRARLDRPSGQKPVLTRREKMTPVGTRSIFENGAWMDAVIYDERAAKPGAEFSGLAVIELDDTTIVVGPNQRARIDGHLNVIIDVH